MLSLVKAFTVLFVMKKVKFHNKSRVGYYKVACICTHAHTYACTHTSLLPLLLKKSQTQHKIGTWYPWQIFGPAFDGSIAKIWLKNSPLTPLLSVYGITGRPSPDRKVFVSFMAQRSECIRWIKFCLKCGMLNCPWLAWWQYSNKIRNSVWAQRTRPWQKGFWSFQPYSLSRDTFSMSFISSWRWKQSIRPRNYSFRARSILLQRLLYTNWPCNRSFQLCETLTP